MGHTCPISSSASQCGSTKTSQKVDLSGSRLSGTGFAVLSTLASSIHVLNGGCNLSGREVGPQGPTSSKYPPVIIGPYQTLTLCVKWCSEELEIRI